MTTLAQIITVEKGVKARSLSGLTAAHRDIQKLPLLTGISRTYQRKDDEDGEQLPSESHRVQIKAENVLTEVATLLTRLFDLTATKDWTNCEAKADVVVDGRTIVRQAPVPYLLFLEKQLTDLHTFFNKTPVLDPAEEWTFDASADCFKTGTVRTVRTKKVPRNHVKAEATEQHPAQVEMYFEDVPVGYWNTVKFSGALSAKRRNELLNRVDKLQEAVKSAREEANRAEVTDQQVGEAVFDYLLDA